MNNAEPIFVVQLHDATRLHYDFRLQMGKVLKSWAVPKGPPTESGIKRLAVETTDHPLDWANFQGEIPAGNYGAGSVETWDIGIVTYVLDLIATPKHDYEDGKLIFALSGKRLKGEYTLLRIQGIGPKSHWLLSKHN